MLDTSKPMLVVVNGPAVGGGSELAPLVIWWLRLHARDLRSRK